MEPEADIDLMGRLALGIDGIGYRMLLAPQVIAAIMLMLSHRKKDTHS
jgi:hypothetical protein